MFTTNSTLKILRLINRQKIIICLYAVQVYYHDICDNNTNTYSKASLFILTLEWCNLSALKAQVFFGHI